MSRCYCSLLLVLLLSLLVSFVTAAASTAQPTAEQIAQWVRQLGDNSFAVREDASKKLWAAGQAAEAALEEALKSDDVEVVRRARDILDKFKTGIYPDTPPEIVALIQAYPSAEVNGRAEIVQKLLRAGTNGLQAILKMAQTETNPHQRRLLGHLVSTKLPAALPSVLADGRFEKFDSLLERAHDGEFVDHNHYTAYWLLRGKLDERIAAARKRPMRNRLAETLLYLYRAKGDLVEARKAAEKTERPDLLEGILYESADWKSLAARPGVTAAQSDIEKWGFRAAYARLAGDQKAFESALQSLGKLTEQEKGPERDSYQFAAIKAYFLNDRPAEGLALLAKSPPYYQGVLFEILCARLDYRAALALTDSAPSKGDKVPTILDVQKARILYLLGEHDKAQAIFARCAEAIKDGIEANWVHNLLKEEYRAGLKDQSFEHCAKALSVWPKTLAPPVEGTLAGSFVSQVFPTQATTAEVWWEVLRKKFPNEAAATILKRLRDLLEGKVAAKEVQTWIEENERRLSLPNAGLRPRAGARQRQAMAEAAVQVGLNDLAYSLLEKADTSEALIRLGDLLAARKEWGKAAERYRQAWKKELDNENPSGEESNFRPNGSNNPLPLYLAGHALVKAGQVKEGKAFIEQSHWVPLGDSASRYSFARALLERGHKQAAQREADLVMRVSDPNSFYSGSAVRLLALAAAGRKEYQKAAEGCEQSMLRCLHAGTNFVAAGAFATVPAQVHQFRAKVFLAAGKNEEADKQIELALLVSPGNAELAIALVPDLEQRGRKKEAAALFERCSRVLEKLCQDYPRCGWAHNSAAWMSACCRRNLDAALRHAQKAVELAPTNAGYHDTLAEVHFQRGDKQQAVALQKRVIELNPKRQYFRKQLRRLEAGDPSAERPSDEEE